MFSTVETLYNTIYYSKYFIELNMISLHNMLPFELTKDTPYLALSGELWSVFYEYFNRNWSCYKGFLLYIAIYAVSHAVDVLLPLLIIYHVKKRRPILL